MKNTLADVKVEIGIKYSHVLDLSIEAEEGKHAAAHIVLEMEAETTDAEIQRVKNQNVKISIDGKVLFAGTCIGINYTALSGYYNVIVQCASKTYQMDQKQKNRRFQNPSVTIKDVIDETLKEYGVSISYSENRTLGQVISQNQETDWEFIKRVAATQQMSVYVDARDPGGRIFVGKTGFRTFEELDKSSAQCGVSRSLTEMGMREANGEEAQSYTLDVYDCVSSNLEISAGDNTGKYVIRHSTIKNRSGILENCLNYGYSYSVRPDTAAVNGPQETSSVLTGTVMAVSGNQIQVALDNEAGGGGQTWIPYESFLSNSFYCMPDVGDTVFIYYENNGNIVCLGSKHTNTDHPDFSKPNENVFTNKNKMIKHEEKALKITATRDLCDAESEQEISIIMSDEDGITINSGRDITITSDENIVLGAKTPRDADELYRSGKEKLGARRDASREEYVASAGILDYAGLAARQTGSKILDSGLDQLKSAVFYDVWHKDKKAESETIASENYESGVLTLYGYESAQLVVGKGDSVDTGIRLDSNLSFSAEEFTWLGYQQGEHEKEEKPLQDWWETALDGLQLALDIAGCFPILGAVPDLINAGISFARGDFVGGGMSLIAAIPIVGDAVGAAKTVVKGTKLVSKAMKYMSKAEKLIKYAKGIYGIAQGLYGIYQSNDGLKEIYEKIKNGENPWDDPETWSTIFNASQGAVGAGKATHEMYKAVKGPKGGDSKKSKENTEEKGKSSEGDATKSENNSKCGDPINMVTGSLTLNYTDLTVHDINGSFTLQRMHESIHSNEGMMLGNRWYLNIETRLTIDKNRISLQKMDMTLEYFSLQEGKWINEKHNHGAYVLTQKDDGYEVWENSTKKKYLYDTDGKIVQIQDRCGNRTRFEYKNHQLIQMTFASGQWLKFEYCDGKLNKITDTIGRTVEYGYNDKLLMWVKLANGGKISYVYDKYHCIHQITDQNNQTYVTTEYDHRRRAVRQSLITGEEYVIFYDDKNQKTIFTNLKNDSKVVFEYGNQKVPVREIYEDGTYIEKKYDSQENCIYYKDRNGNETCTEYDEQGNVTKIIYPDQSFDQFAYDAAGNLICKENSGGSCEKFTYNEKNLLTAYRQRIMGETYALTKYTYDHYGRLLSVVNPNGNKTVYSYEESNHFQDWSYKTLPEKESFIRKYDRAGRCIEETNEFGTKHMSYTPMDDVCVVTEAEEQRTEYHYDLLGNLKEKRLPVQGKTMYRGIRYAYDGLDHKIKEISPLGNVYAYEYGNEDELIRSIHPAAYAAGKKDGIVFAYDHYGNNIQTLYPDGGMESRAYDANGNLIRQTMPEGQEMQQYYRYIYDCMDRVTRIEDAEGKCMAAYSYDTEGRITAFTGEGKEYPDLFTYNACGWLTSVRKAVKKDDAGNVQYYLVTYNYDAMGNRTVVKRYLDYQSVDSAKGRCHEIHYCYDKSNRLVEVSDSTGAEETYTYDKGGRLQYRRSRIAEGVVQETGYKYDRADRIIEIWERMEKAAGKTYGSNYSKTVYTYDANGNVTQILLPDGGTITYTYDADDRVAEEQHRDATGIDCQIAYSYDAAGNRTGRKITDGKETVYAEETHAYDLMNREIRYVDGEGGMTTRSYDQNGRLKTVVMANENAKVAENALYRAHGYTYHYDQQDRLLSVMGPEGFLLECSSYDPAGNLSVRTDAEGNRVKFDYDLAGRNTRITSAGGSTQDFTYDAAGNVERATDGMGETTQFINDMWGRATEVVRADGETERYVYDHAGNVIAATDAEGNTVTYSFGERNQLVERTDAFGQTEYFCYDRAGNLAEHVDRNGSRVTYAYNMYGSPTERIAQAAWNSSDGTDHMCGRIQENYQYDRTGRLTAAISGGMRYDYRYDRKNQLLAKTAGGRTLVSYAYDAEGNRTASMDVTGNCTRYTYDLLGRMTGVRDEKTGFRATYEYTKAGDLKKVDTPVLNTVYAYDEDRNLMALRTTASMEGMEKLLADNVYRYNKNGQRTEKTTLAGTTKYTYDVLGQLIQENNHIYTYDRAGNRTSVQAGDRREIYHYDRGRLTTRTVERAQDPAGKTYTYRYDAQGNTLGDGENTYLYDCLNRIAEVQTKAGDIQKNHYDAEGLRSQMEENGKLVSFVYADREVITEEDEAGAHIRYIRGHELLASDSAHARTYYHYACDEMGSITDITDCDGTVLNHYAYDAFGNRTVEEEIVENRFGFAGEMMDAVTGQYYLRARFYNPVIARFLSEDTYYGDGLNLYAYCHNNPVGYVDPSGHEGLICSKKYGELKKKEAEGGTLSEKEKRQIYEYEQNQKKSNGAGSDSKSGSSSNGIVNGKTPASRFADKLRGLSNSKRPNTVAVVRTADGKYYVGYNKAGIHNNNIQKVLDYLGNNNLYNRQCAEVNAISRAFNDGADLKGATISIANVRKASDVSGVHGTYKAPCDVCQPLIDFFGIEDIH